MFEFGTLGEVFIIAVAALILIGPKELPALLRTCGRLVQKLRRLTSGIRSQFNTYLHEGEFEEYQQQLNDIYINANKEQNPARAPKRRNQA